MPNNFLCVVSNLQKAIILRYPALCPILKESITIPATREEIPHPRESLSGGGAPLRLVGPHFLVGSHKLTTKVVGVNTPLRIPHYGSGGKPHYGSGGKPH